LSFSKRKPIALGGSIGRGYANSLQYLLGIGLESQTIISLRVDKAITNLKFQDTFSGLGYLVKKLNRPEQVNPYSA
jgi:hypothetical protein